MSRYSKGSILWARWCLVSVSDLLLTFNEDASNASAERRFAVFLLCTAASTSTSVARLSTVHILVRSSVLDKYSFSPAVAGHEHTNLNALRISGGRITELVQALLFETSAHQGSRP